MAEFWCFACGGTHATKEHPRRRLVNHAPGTFDYFLGTNRLEGVKMPPAEHCVEVKDKRGKRTAKPGMSAAVEASEQVGSRPTRGRRPTPSTARRPRSCSNLKPLGRESARQLSPRSTWQSCRR